LIVAGDEITGGRAFSGGQMRRIERFQPGLDERAGAILHCGGDARGMRCQIQAGFHPFPSFNRAAFIVFQNMESGTDQFRLTFFHHLKNQHEAKCFQPDTRCRWSS